MAKQKEMIECKGCGKTIEKKVNRLYCIKCRYKIDMEIQKMRQEAKKSERTGVKVITVSKGKRHEEFIG